MRKTSFTAFLSVAILFSLLTGCNKPKVAPVSERIAKVWTAQKVEENSTTVYTRGVTPFVRNYSSFKLDLSKPPAVIYTDYDAPIGRRRETAPPVAPPLPPQGGVFARFLDGFRYR